MKTLRDSGPRGKKIDNYQKKIKIMFFTGIFIAIGTFVIIGVFHPIVIKCEYYFGTSQWWLFLVVGLATLLTALFVEDVLASSLLGVFGASCLWSIGELFEQKKRVEKGWFPMNPRRKNEYKK